MHHWNKKLSIKNWKTGEILNFDSQIEFCKKYKIPIQACSDVFCRRRKFYKQFSLPDFQPNFFKYGILNLKNSKILKFKSISAASKILHIDNGAIKKLVTNPNFRHGNLAHVDFQDWDSIPKVRNKCNGQITTVFDIKKFAEQNNLTYKHVYYFLNAKRIASDSKFELLGQRNFKYKIEDLKSGQVFGALKLCDFAERKGFYKSKLYTRNKRFEVIEG